MKARYNNVGTFRIIQGSNGRFLLQQKCNEHGRVAPEAKSTNTFDPWTKVGPYMTRSEAEAELLSRHVIEVVPGSQPHP